MSLRRGLGFSQSRPGSLSLQMLHVIHSTRCELRDIAAANHSQLLQLSRLEVDLQRGLHGPPRTLMRFWTEPLRCGAARCCWQGSSTWKNFLSASETQKATAHRSKRGCKRRSRAPLHRVKVRSPRSIFPEHSCSRPWCDIRLRRGIREKCGWSTGYLLQSGPRSRGCCL